MYITFNIMENYASTIENFNYIMGKSAFAGSCVND